MKFKKFLNTTFLLFIASLLCLQVTNAQEVKKNKKEQKKSEIQGLIQSKSFVFVAQSAFPLSGRNINLTSMYSLKLSSDTVISDLPYFGRAYVAPMNPTEGGIQFTSTKFTYTVAARKKGGWDITVLPTDTRDVRQMFLTVSEDGYASLQVASNNRQDINFNGYITAKNKFK